MPKFKPGNIVARVVLGKSWRKRHNMDYLHEEFGRYPPQYYDDDDDGDKSSTISTSSTATFDDLPGAGHTIDKYMYQPMGRWIERIAMRYTIAYLNPAIIAQYLGSEVSVFFVYGLPLHVAIEGLYSDLLNGSTIAAGLKGLVKQTQSNSIDRSAAALAALIRVSLVEYNIEVYANISCIEPIFHLESLVCSHPDKKWFLFLVKLGRETHVAIRRSSKPSLEYRLSEKNVSLLRPSQETAQNLRQRLIRVLKVYRFSGLVSLEDTIGEACAICAEVVSTRISQYARGDAYIHILDTVYFTIIFILRSIYELADLAKITNSKLIYMVLRTLACWMDGIVFQCTNCAPYLDNYDLDLLKVTIAVRSLVLVDVENEYMLLPESCRAPRRKLLTGNGIPRRNREGNKYIHHIESLIEAAKQRTRRLLGSFDALEMEVRGCTLQSNYCTTQSKINADPSSRILDDFGDEWWNSWKITFERARRVRVRAFSLTEEFSYARSFDFRGWAVYQLRRGSRHKWGQYFRSNMDWDWDLGTCMRRLFKVEPTREGHPPAAQCSPVTYFEIDVDAEQGATWRMGAQGSLPKEVQIAYKTETGETQYVSFAPTYPIPRHNPASERSSAGLFEEEGFDPTVVQQDLGYRKASSCEEQVVEDLATCASFSDASPPEACDETPVESNYDSEGKETTYDIRFDGVRMGGDDLISICSLD